MTFAVLTPDFNLDDNYIYRETPPLNNIRQRVDISSKGIVGTLISGVWANLRSDQRLALEKLLMIL